MPLFTLHRDYLLRSTKGHAIDFKKDVPTLVPDACVPDVVNIGGRAVDGDVDVIPVEEKPTEVLTRDERKQRVFAAFKEMQERDNRGDFTASGTPNAKKLIPMVGFDMSTSERDELWREYRTQELADDLG